MDDYRYVGHYQGCEVGEDILHHDYTVTEIKLEEYNHGFATIINNSKIPVCDQIRYTFRLEQQGRVYFFNRPIKICFTDQLGRISEGNIGFNETILPPGESVSMDFIVEDCPVEYVDNLRIKAELAVDRIPLGTLPYLEPRICSTKNKEPSKKAVRNLEKFLGGE